MKYIKVAEVKNGKEKVIFENTFQKLILCTDQHQGNIGFDSPMDLVKTLEEMVQSWCVNSLDIDEDSEMDDLIEAAVLQASIGANIALLVLGPLGDMIIEHEEDPEILAKGKKLVAIAENVRDMLVDRLDGMTSNFSIRTMGQFKEEMGRELMEELEEFEKRDDK